MKVLRVGGVRAIPEIVEADLAIERPYFVMPWFEAGSLDDHLPRAKNDPERQRELDLLLAIASALSEIHSAGFAHRDVKPSNVLLRDGDIALTDFGLCLHIDEIEARLTAQSEPIGSWLYTAPENEGGLNEEVDQRPADFYAFGKLMWAVLVGERPPTRELHVEGPNLLAGRLADSRFERLHPLLEQLANADPRARLADWGAVDTELRSLKQRLEGVDVPEPTPVSPDALERARRIALLPQVADVLRDRELEARQREWLGTVFSQMGEASRAVIDARLTELSAATQGAYQFTFSSGGESVSTLFRLGSLEIADFDPAAPTSFGEGSRLLLHGYSPIGAELPAINLAVHISLQRSGLWILRIPSLVTFPGLENYLFPEPIISSLFAYRGPFRLYLPGSSDVAVEFAVESARAFVRFAEAYLVILDSGDDYGSAEAWARALGSR